MSSIDVAALLADRVDNPPSGKDLQEDGDFAFFQLLEDAKYKPATQVGDSVIPEVEPSWNAIFERTLETMEKSHDLRLGVLLVASSLVVEGFAGLARSLEVIEQLVNERWDTVHPRLDVYGEPDDPEMRKNVLDGLAPSIGTLGDEYRVQERLRLIPLVSHKVIGRFSLRDMLVTKGAVTPKEDEEPVDQARIDAAFNETDVETLQEVRDQLARAKELVGSIEAGFREKAGGMAPDLVSFAKLLADMGREFDEKLAMRGYGDAPAPEGGEAAGGGQSGGGGVTMPMQQGLSGEVTTRAEVRLALDKVIRYYETNEPSSPVPILLKRAGRLVDKSFMDIMRNIAPDQLSAIETLAGPDATE